MATNGMSRWEMLTKARPQQRVYSRSQRVATSNDIQDWIKKVQTASEQTAAVETIESMYTASQKYSTHLTDVVKHVEDAAVLEAQALIEQYVKKKLNSDDEHGSESDDSTRIVSGSKNKAKSLWELADVGNENSHFEDKRYEIVKNFHKKNDPFKILEKDDSELLDSVLNGLLKKDFVSDGYVKKFVHKEESSGIDPSTKMAVRHAQVKENRERRRVEKENRLRELQEMREVQLKARQTLMKEEKQKEIQAKREEVELQKEMTRLRKELEEERKKSEADQQKKLKEEEELKRLAKEELKKELAKEQEEARIELARANQKREKVLNKMAEIEKRRAKENLKLKRLAFSSWYGVVLERRINIGKAKATSDWKVLFRAFTAWKNQCKGRKAEQEASRHASLIKEMHRKELKACDHFRICLLRKIFSAWNLYVTREQNLRSQIKTQNETKTKMAAFLEAAATGRLWTDRSQETGRTNLSSRNQDKQTSTNTAENGLFRQRRGSVGSFSSKSPHSSARSEETAPQNIPLSSNKITRPTEPWQITRKNLHLVDELNLELSQKRPIAGRDVERHDDVISSCARPATSGPSRRPVRLKQAFAVNNYEHRHHAQQKVLETQQLQLKEQKRLIEDLQHLQHQQLIHQQLTHQQLMKVQVPTGGGAGAAVTGSDLQKLQSHIDWMRKELEKNGAIKRFNDGEETEPAASSNRSNPESSAHPTGRSESSSALSGISKPSDNPKHLRFLKAMEERASERERLKKEREEKRRKQEEERLQQLRAEAEEKQLQEDEEKRQRLRDARQKKEQERQNQLKQQEEAEKMRQLMVVSEEHRKKSTMKFWGFLPWKKLVQDTKTKREKAIQKYNIDLQRKVLLSWHTKILEDSREKQKKADDMYHYLLVKRCISAWKRCKNYAAVQEERANRHYDRYLMHRVLTSWLDYSTEEKVKGWQKERKAKEFHSMSIVRIAFRAWRRFPVIIKEDRAKRQRLEEMRKKVAAFIPDFQPPSVDLSQASLD